MKFLGIGLLALAALIALPPLVYALLPADVPELPPAGRRVEIAPGVGVNLLEMGKGTPVVFVHGHPGTAYDWLAMLSRVSARGHRAIAYDRVGYGRSDGRTGPYLVDANANELLALLERKDSATSHSSATPTAVQPRSRRLRRTPRALRASC